MPLKMYILLKTMKGRLTMKIFFALLILALGTTTAFAQRHSEIFGDLSTIGLYEDITEKSERVSYPGLHGSDCFILDVGRGPKPITLNQKLALARKLIILDDEQLLVPTKKGTNVVFNLKSKGKYTTLITVKTKSGKSFTDSVTEVFADRTNSTEYVSSLIFVEECRL